MHALGTQRCHRQQRDTQRSIAGSCPRRISRERQKVPSPVRQIDVLCVFHCTCGTVPAQRESFPLDCMSISRHNLALRAMMLCRGQSYGSGGEVRGQSCQSPAIGRISAIRARDAFGPRNIGPIGGKPTHHVVVLACGEGPRLIVQPVKETPITCRQAADCRQTDGSCRCIRRGTRYEVRSQFAFHG